MSGNVTIDLTVDEVQALAGLLDAAVRSVGLRAAKDAASIIGKLETAADQANLKPVRDGKS